MITKILIADDHLAMREGLRTLIQRETDLELVGEAANGRVAVQLTGELMPDVVIMDLNMPEISGVEATRRIKAKFPGVKVIALSMYSDKHHVTAMARAGASEYLRKDRGFAQLVEIVRRVAGK